MQVIHRVRIFLAKNGDKHIRSGHFLLAVGRGLDVHDGALNDALKTQCRLGVDFFIAGHHGGVFLDEAGQIFAQVVQICRAGAQNLGR